MVKKDKCAQFFTKFDHNNTELQLRQCETQQAYTLSLEKFLNGLNQANINVTYRTVFYLTKDNIHLYLYNPLMYHTSESSTRMRRQAIPTQITHTIALLICNIINVCDLVRKSWTHKKLQ